MDPLPLIQRQFFPSYSRKENPELTLTTIISLGTGAAQAGEW